MIALIKMPPTPSIPSIIVGLRLQWLFLLSTSSTIVIVHAARKDLIAIIQRLNADLLELRNEIEHSISNRCASIAGCSKSSYDECQSEYTTRQTCPAFEKYGASSSLFVNIVNCCKDKIGHMNMLNCAWMYDSSHATIPSPPISL